MAASIDIISQRFLKDGANIFAILITQICNLSFKLSNVLDNCKLTKLFLKKSLKQILKTFD